MTTLSRRGLLATTGAVSLAGVLAACADTGADGKAVASSSASDADYDKATALPSAPVSAQAARTPARERAPVVARSPRRERVVMVFLSFGRGGAVPGAGPAVVAALGRGCGSGLSG